MKSYCRWCGNPLPPRKMNKGRHNGPIPRYCDGRCRSMHWNAYHRSHPDKPRHG